MESRRRDSRCSMESRRGLTPARLLGSSGRPKNPANQERFLWGMMGSYFGVVVGRNKHSAVPAATRIAGTVLRLFRPTVFALALAKNVVLLPCHWLAQWFVTFVATPRAAQHDCFSPFSRRRQRRRRGNGEKGIFRGV